MNKVTLSVAALAAIGAPASIQAQEDAAKPATKAEIEKYNVSIQKTIELVNTYSDVKIQYLQSLYALIEKTMDGNGNAIEKSITEELIAINLAKAEIIAKEASEAQLPYTYMANFTKAYNEAEANYETAKGILSDTKNFNEAFRGEYTESLNWYYNGRAADLDKDITAIEGLTQITFGDYKPGDDAEKKKITDVIAKRVIKKYSLLLAYIHKPTR